MNIYDQAHKLARSLHESKECQELLAAKTKLAANPVWQQMLQDWREKQWEVHQAALAGQEAPELQQEYQRIAELVRCNPSLQEYLGAEFRVAQMLTDIQKIIVDGVRDCFPAAEPEEHK